LEEATERRGASGKKQTDTRKNLGKDAGEGGGACKPPRETDCEGRRLGKEGGEIQENITKLVKSQKEKARAA